MGRIGAPCSFSALQLCLVEVGTAQKESTQRTHQLATLVAKLRGAVGADLHDFPGTHLSIGREVGFLVLVVHHPNCPEFHAIMPEQRLRGV